MYTFPDKYRDTDRDSQKGPNSGPEKINVSPNATIKPT